MEAVDQSNVDILRACPLCTFNVAAIFFRGHPYVWRTTVLHDSLPEQNADKYVFLPFIKVKHSSKIWCTLAFCSGKLFSTFTKYKTVKTASSLGMLCTVVYAARDYCKTQNTFNILCFRNPTKKFQYNSAQLTQLIH